MAVAGIGGVGLSGGGGSLQTLTQVLGQGNTSSGLDLVMTLGDDLAIGGVLATTATAGFLRLPTTAGVPTGVPTGFAGTSSTVIDSSSHVMYFYSGGAWHAVESADKTLAQVLATGNITDGTDLFVTDGDTIDFGGNGNLSWSVTDSEIQSSVDFYAPSVRTDTATLHLDNAMSLSTNSSNLELVDQARSQNKEAISFDWDVTGSTAPTYPSLAAEATASIQALEDTSSGAFTFTIAVALDNKTVSATYKPTAAGTAIFKVQFTDASGVNLVSQYTQEITAPEIGTEVIVPLPNPISMNAGEFTFITYSGPALAGHVYAADPTYGTGFYPFLKLTFNAITANTIPSASASLTANHLVIGDGSAGISSFAGADVSGDDITFNGDLGIGIDPTSPLHTKTDTGVFKGENQYSINLRRDGTGGTEYFLLGKVAETGTNGHVQISGILAGRDETHGRANVNIMVSAETTFDVTGPVSGDFVSTDIVVYLDVGEYYIWLKTDVFSEVNLNTAMVGTSSSLDWTGVSDTPSGTLAYTLGTDIGKTLRINEDGYLGVGTVSPSTALDVVGDATISGIIALDNNKITGLATPTDDADAVNKAYVLSQLGALSWLTRAHDFFDPTSALPSTPATGDRWIASATANGWTVNYIYEYNGATWDEEIPLDGEPIVVYDPDPNEAYIFNGATWVNFGTVADHNQTTGKQGGTTDEFYHLTVTDYNALIDINAQLTSLHTDGAPQFASVSATTFSGDLSGTVNTTTTGATQSPGDNSTKIATTAYVEAAVGVEDHWDRSGTTLSPTNAGDKVSTTGNIGAGILAPTSPVHTLTSEGSNQYSINVRLGGITGSQYYLLGKLDETATNGHIAVNGIMGGRDATHGRALIGLMISAETNFDVIGLVHGNFANCDLVVYLNAGFYEVYLKADAFAEVNINLAEVGANSSLNWDGTFSTLTPTGTLSYTLSTDIAGTIRTDLNGNIVTEAGVDETVSITLNDSSGSPRLVMSYDDLLDDHTLQAADGLILSATLGNVFIEAEVGDVRVDVGDDSLFSLFRLDGSDTTHVFEIHTEDGINGGTLNLKLGNRDPVSNTLTSSPNTLWSVHSGANSDLLLNVGATGLTNEYVSLRENSTLVFGAKNLNTSTTTNYLWAGNRNQSATTDPDATRIVMIRPGILKGFSISHSESALGNGNNIVYTVLLNGSPTTITVTVASNSEVAVLDTTHTVLFSAGDIVTLQATKASAINISPTQIQGLLGVQ